MAVYTSLHAARAGGGGASATTVDRILVWAGTRAVACCTKTSRARRMSGGFDDLGLMPELVKATSEQNWVLPSDVQDESIPLIMGGGDVMVVRVFFAWPRG